MSGHIMQEQYQPSDRIRSLIMPIVPRIIERAGTKGLVSLVVLGSAARGEETWRNGRLVGDIDLEAVLTSPDPLTAIRFQRAAYGLVDGIELGYFPLYSLKRYRTLFFYEAKQAGWILWGSPDVFDRVRMNQARDIPRWEGVRLVLNRMVDCLRARAGLIPPWYAATKSYLALGEAELVFQEGYVPSYRSRLRQLEGAGQVLGSTHLLDRVRWATGVKLGADVDLAGWDSAEHERWLLDGATALLSRYLGHEVTLLEGLAQIARTCIHPVHRAVYLARHRRQPRSWLDLLRRDPVFGPWEQAVRCLQGDLDLTPAFMRESIHDFDHTLQPLCE